jgi:hypothetical protein
MKIEGLLKARIREDLKNYEQISNTERGQRPQNYPLISEQDSLIGLCTSLMPHVISQQSLHTEDAAPVSASGSPIVPKAFRMEIPMAKPFEQNVQHSLV